LCALIVVEVINDLLEGHPPKLAPVLELRDKVRIPDRLAPETGRGHTAGTKVTFNSQEKHRLELRLDSFC
jgi:hypothetical protein